MTPIEVVSEMAVVAVCDPSVGLPSGPDPDALVRELEPMARSGQVFYLVADDPLRCRIGLLTGEDPPPTLARDFEPSGGTFGLELPSGKVAVHGWSREGAPTVAGGVDCTPGPQVLSVLVRRPLEASRHEEDMRALLGPDWTYLKRVNRLGLLGCLPLAVTAVTILAQKWQWLGYVLPLLALSWAPYLVLRRTARYRGAERTASEVEHARPDFVLSIVSAERPGLPGGFVRV